MAKRPKKPPTKQGYEETRFNATKYGILSRYTVLPWENAGEYRELYEALIAEYKPEGPTEGHLVEELAGIVWRKQRLRMAEAGAARHSLDELTTKRWQSRPFSVFDFNAILDDEEEPNEEILWLLAIPPYEVSAMISRSRP